MDLDKLNLACCFDLRLLTNDTPSPKNIAHIRTRSRVTQNVHYLATFTQIRSNSVIHTVEVKDNKKGENIALRYNTCCLSPTVNGFGVFSVEHVDNDGVDEAVTFAGRWVKPTAVVARVGTPSPR